MVLQNGGQSQLIRFGLAAMYSFLQFCLRNVKLHLTLFQANVRSAWYKPETNKSTLAVIFENQIEQLLGKFPFFYRHGESSCTSLILHLFERLLRVGLNC